MDQKPFAIRRSVLRWLAGASWIVVGAGLPGQSSAQPHAHGPLDADERRRLRGELRQAHRERMQQSGGHHGPGSHEHGRAGAGGPYPDAIPASGSDREGHRSHSREAAHAMPLTDEERKQLRRQLRAQREARRESQTGDSHASPHRAPGSRD